MSMKSPAAAFSVAVRWLFQLSLLCATSAFAATLTVTSTADDGGAATLRAAVASAIDGDRIEFALPNPSVITLNGSKIQIRTSIDISGPGATALTIRQQADSYGLVAPLFWTPGGLTIALSGLTLTQTLAPEPGGVGFTGATAFSLVLSDMAFRFLNSGVLVNGAATIQRSTFHGNIYSIISTASATTAMIRETAITGGMSHGLLLAQGDITLFNSTIATTDLAAMVGQVTTLRVVNSTIAGNRIGFDVNDIRFPWNHLSFRNSLLANNSEGNCTTNANTIADSGGYNLDSDGSCGLTGVADQSGTPASPLDAKLGPLTNNGGPTQSLAPAADSPVVNAVPAEQCRDLDNLPVVTDQRGRPRPSGSGCDIGSVELQYLLDVDRNLAGPPNGALTDGLLILRHLAGIPGSALTVHALSTSASRTEPDVIAAYVNSIASELDIDDNGVLSPSVDGVLILRYLLGLRGNALIAGVVDSSSVPVARRTSAAAIEAYLDGLATPR